MVITGRDAPDWAKIVPMNIGAKNQKSVATIRVKTAIVQAKSVE